MLEINKRLQLRCLPMINANLSENLFQRLPENDMPLFFHKPVISGCHKVSKFFSWRKFYFQQKFFSLERKKLFWKGTLLSNLIKFNIFRKCLNLIQNKSRKVCKPIIHIKIRWLISLSGPPTPPPPPPPPPPHLSLYLKL